MKQFLLFLSFPILMFCSCTKDPKGIVNMRDLSNYIIADSLHIRQGMLFRAAHLADATDDEIQYLATLPTTKIIDFRLEDEKRDRADRVVHGAEYINIPIDASGNVMAQATDEEKKKFGGNKRFDLRKIIVMIAFNDKAKKVAREIYHNLFFNSDCQAQYAHFFRELIATDTGAILYHCTQGKDRTGVASALLLAALGADRETIIADFDATNAVYEADIRKYSRRVRFFGGKEDEVAVVKAFIGVNTDNFVRELKQIDEQYGSIENYLKGPIGLTDDDINTLRKRYIIK
ncbi:MAG: tyrosine-protein phosphatase [Paludibacteraceae bacterium]|nr:tyrosine-protein phosphatase [Paludibacteraceae bacterium]